MTIVKAKKPSIRDDIWVVDKGGVPDRLVGGCSGAEVGIAP